jgi:hypothetical protein
MPTRHAGRIFRLTSRTIASLVLITGIASLPALTAGAQDDPLSALFADLPTDPQALADQIVADVVAIRGLELREAISVENQSEDDFETYLDAAIEQSLPRERAAVFGSVVTKLGLYRGPDIDDIGELMKFVMTSQAAAYYDPDTGTFYVLIENAPPLVTGTVYAHELYHGLQDQYYDLDAFILDQAGGALNDDELLARQAVVEGEATYVMTLWATRHLTGQVPSPFALDLAVQMQSQLDVASMIEMLEEGALPNMLGDDSQAMIAAMSEIPPFLIETLIGAYLKGMAFVHEVVKNDWSEADRLYADPPRSTEQILHPEKWLERDDPIVISLPNAVPDALTGWTLLDSNVLGEVQWRIIFNEHGLSDRSAALAAGWDGDRYAVLERDGDLLLLLYTTWDSEAEAAEFAAGYESLLGVKYADRDEPTAVDLRGSDVLIVEGGDADRMADYLAALSVWTRE